LALGVRGLGIRWLVSWVSPGSVWTWRLSSAYQGLFLSLHPFLPLSQPPPVHKHPPVTFFSRRVADGFTFIRKNTSLDNRVGNSFWSGLGGGG
jgi:hypothetical protein